MPFYYEHELLNFVQVCIHVHITYTLYNINFDL